MRILHVCAQYRPSLGGIESYLGEFSRRLARDGHAVTVVTTDAAEGRALWDPASRRHAVRRENLEGVDVQRFPPRYLPLAPWSHVAARYLSLWLAGGLARLTVDSPPMRRWLTDTAAGVDVVAGAGVLYAPFVRMAVDFARRRRAPCVVVPFTHLGAGTVPGGDPVGRHYTQRHQSALAAAADAVVVMTAAERDFYEGRGVDSRRLHIVSPGIDPTALAGGDGARFRGQHAVRGPLVTFLSAAAYDKGANHVVEAAARLWEQGREVELVLAGTPWPDFRRRFEQLPDHVRRRVRLLGPIAEADKRDLLAATDVLVMPSRTDSFGIVFLEAWLYGKPVIGSTAWGMSDVIRDGVDGCLVPFADVEALAARLAALLDDPERRAALGAAGRRKVLAGYTWDRQYARLRDVYLGLTAAA